MPLGLVYPANTLSSGFEVANSCRFNGDAYMHKSLSETATHADKCTFSIWVKPQVSDTRNTFVAAGVDSGNYMKFRFQDDKLALYGNRSSGNDLHVVTNRVFRDPSAWYHIVLQIDTTQSSSSDRVKFFVNGVQETSMSTTTYMAQNADCFLNGGVSGSKLFIGAFDTAADDGVDEQGEGYFAEVALIDGSILAPTEFGEFSETSPTIWKPKDISGLTFGANGFYLDFEDSSNLGNDKNGGTDLTEVSLAAGDQATDTPTNSFCTLNPLDNYYAGYTFSEGNCKIVTANTPEIYTTSTLWVTSGKWYAEGKLINASGADILGIASNVAHSNSDTNHLGEKANNWGLYNGGSGGTAIIYGDASSDSQTATTGLADFTTDDIMGIYLDLDNNKLYFSKNGSLYSSTGLSLTDPGSLTTAGTMGAYTFAFGEYGGSAPTWEVNFGGCPAFSLSSAVSDDNGYGNFEYSPNITGDSEAKKFYALCTKNLAEFGG